MNQITKFKDTLARHEQNLIKCEDKFKAVLPDHIKPSKIRQSVLNALSQNQYLATNCDPGSIMQAAMTAAVLGLEVDNVTGQGYITPFRGKAQFIPGYKGYITLAQNSGFLVSGDVVRENDVFSYVSGLNPNLEHVPARGGPNDRGAIQYAYAVARHKDLPPVFAVVHTDEINKIRDNSEGYKAFMAGKIKSTPWADHYDKMAKKTAIRALAPQLPLNVQRAHQVESAYESGKVSYIDHEEFVQTESQVENSGGTTEYPDLTEELGWKEMD